jgi:probable F420-dependent oxidoreductase
MSPRVRLSVTTPVVTLLPGGHARWEEEASIEEVARVAEAADALGYHHLTCSEHIGVPRAEAGRRGATYWDPLATFGFLAARTSRIRLATNVLVLGYHHPLEIAKRYGTLDRVSRGRLILGVGVGTLREEFELLGAPFEDRGVRADDALRALRASLSIREPAYHGDHHSFEGLVVDPCAVQERVPIWVGGRTLRSLRRAVSLGDGWAPFGISSADAAAWLGRFDLPPDFAVVLQPGRPLDPGGEPGATEERLDALQQAGATIVSAHVVHHSLAHLLEQLEALIRLSPGGSSGRSAADGSPTGPEPPGRRA